jgi:hypothetical protein
MRMCKLTDKECDEPNTENCRNCWTYTFISSGHCTLEQWRRFKKLYNELYGELGG